MEIFIGLTIGGILTMVLLGVWCSLVVAGDLEREKSYKPKNTKNTKRSKNGK